MELLFDEALCVRSSLKILFFRQVWDHDIEQSRWVIYHKIKIRGFIYFIKGNVRIQIVSDNLIYFYLVDPITFIPTLENVMFNYMDCTQMMIGSHKKYAITYKGNERGFEIYQRKYLHDLRVCINASNFEGAKALEIISSGLFLISRVDEIIVYDNDIYKDCGKIPITLLDSDSREPNMIIGLQKSLCEKYLGIVSGKNLVMDE